MKRKLIDVWGVVERLSSKCAVTTGEQFEAFIEALQIVLDAPEVPGQVCSICIKQGTEECNWGQHLYHYCTPKWRGIKDDH